MTRKLRGLPMAAPEKQKYMLYNNMMYTVASHLIEGKAGEPLEAFLKEKFFQPLGMASTHLHPPSTKGSRDHMASGHQFDKVSGQWGVFDIPHAPEAQGAGSIVTSSADYIKWVQAMLHRQTPISEASYKALT
jgi:CubicO group peptidase (beta-lactamase class C family)